MTLNACRQEDTVGDTCIEANKSNNCTTFFFVDRVLNDAVEKCSCVTIELISTRYLHRTRTCSFTYLITFTEMFLWRHTRYWTTRRMQGCTTWHDIFHYHHFQLQPNPLPLLRWNIGDVTAMRLSLVQNSRYKHWCVPMTLNVYWIKQQCCLRSIPVGG